jgi:hypothetical protein
MSWASDYLIKQAMEKRAKRWFWRLAQLPPERRLNALRQLTDKWNQQLKAFGGSQYGLWKPKKVRWGDIAHMTRPASSDAENFHAIHPRKHVIEQLRKLFSRPAGRPVLLSSLPNDPKQYVYRGLAHNEATRPASNVFASGYPEVSAGYLQSDKAGTGSGGLLLQLKTPKKSFFTPHLAEVEESVRRKKLRELKRQGMLKPNVGIDPMGELPYYETVLPKYAPDTVQRAYRLSATDAKRLETERAMRIIRSFRPDVTPPSEVTLADLKNLKLQPVNVRISPVLRRMQLAEKAWDAPVMRGLPKGFNP